jgi:hypothetical protein
MNLDILWRVEDEFLRIPQWSTTASPGKQNAKTTTIFSEPKIESGRLSATLQVPDGNESDPSSMPTLEEASDMASNDSTGALWDLDPESEDGSSDFDGEESSEYDSEEEAELHDLLREAMDIASAHPEIFEEKKAFDEKSNDNQFLKALGALRGKLGSRDDYGH